MKTLIFYRNLHPVVHCMQETLKMHTISKIIIKTNLNVYELDTGTV